MAKFSYDILFGSDIKSDLRSKLEIRQNLAKSAKFGEAVAYSGSFAQSKFVTENSTDFKLGYGDVNSTDYDSEVDLSSRTPWSRMWVGIEKFNIDPDIASLNSLSEDDANAYIKKIRDNTGDVKKNINGVDIHTVGNNLYWSYEAGGGTRASEALDPTSVTKGYIQDASPWLSRANAGNDFLESMPGIVDIESADAGDYGLIRETTVRFHIPSYDDYVNVFQPFFLLPGARIFLDFGWSTSDIYDPLEIMKDHLQGKDMFENIWGSEGLVNKSRGDMEVLTGVVSKYDTNVEDDGSFMCSLTIVSYNYKLLDHSTSADLGDDVTIADYIKIGVNERIKDYASGKLGMDLTNIPVDESRLLSEILPTVLAPTQTFSFLGASAPSGEEWKTTGGAKLKAIPEDYYHYGIYFDPLGVMGKRETNKFNAKYTEVTNGEIYVSLQLLEEFLNDYISSQWDKDETNSADGVTDKLMKKPQNVKYNFYGGEYDKLDVKKLDTELAGVENETVKNFQLSQGFTESGTDEAGNAVPKADGMWGPNTKSFYERQMAQCTFDEYLYTKQAYLDSNGQFPFFKYPTKWRIGADGKFEQLTYRKGKYNKSKAVKTGTPESVPVYKIWLRLSSVLSALSKQSIKEGLNDLITTLNRESSGAFNFKLLPNTTKTEIRLYDTNYRPDDTVQVSQQNGITQTVSKLFSFNVFSPNTIVSSLDLKSEMGNDNYSNRMLIQGMSVGNLIFPTSDETLLDLAVKDINASIDDKHSNISNSYFNHLPHISENATENTVKNKIKIYKANLDEDGNVGRGNISGAIISKKFNTLLKRLDTQGFEIGITEKQKKQVTEGLPTASHTFKSTTADCPQGTGPFPKNICVNSLNEFFDTTIRGYRAESSIHAVILPWTLSFSIYGISGLVPGNRFQIDYIPKRYRDVAYFIIERTRHTISGDGWQTHIEARMHFKNDFSLQHSVLYRPNILPSKVLLAKLGYSEDQFEEIYEKATTTGVKRNFWEIIPYNIAVKKGCMDPNAWNFLKTPPDSNNPSWDANSDCAGKRPSVNPSQQETYIDEDGVEVSAERFDSASSEDGLALFVGDKTLQWVSNTDGARDDSCCILCENLGDFKSVCSIPSAFLSEDIQGGSDLLNKLDQFGDLSSEMHRFGHASQKELFEEGLWWIARDSCMCVNPGDFENARFDLSDLNYWNTHGSFNNLSPGLALNDKRQTFVEWNKENPDGDITDWFNSSYPSFTSFSDDDEERKKTNYLSGEPTENIMTIDLPGGNQYTTEGKDEEYFANLEKWMKELTDQDLGPQGTAYAQEFVSVIRAENLYTMISPYDWKAHKLSQLDCEALYPDHKSLQDQKEYLENAYLNDELSDEEYALSQSALNDALTERQVKGFNPITAKKACEDYKKQLAGLYDSTITQIMEGKEITPAKTTLDCWEVDGAGNFTHQFPEMCQQTERLTRTFVSLSRGWSKLQTNNPDVYKGVLLNGVLPSSKKAVDTSTMSKSKRREFFKDNGLTYTDDGDIFYVDDDSDSADNTDGLPVEAYGCTDTEALNYDVTKYAGDTDIYCFYHGCSGCRHYNDYDRFQSMWKLANNSNELCSSGTFASEFEGNQHCIQWWQGNASTDDYYLKKAYKSYSSKGKSSLRTWDDLGSVPNKMQIYMCQGNRACYGEGFSNSGGQGEIMMSFTRGGVQWSGDSITSGKKFQPWDVPDAGKEIFAGTAMDGVDWIQWCMWTDEWGDSNSCKTTCACEIASGGDYNATKSGHQGKCPDTDDYNTHACQYL